MKLKKFLEATDGQITGGTDFQWKCYGPSAQYMDVSDIDNVEVGSCVFDSKTKKVYEITVDVYKDNVAYRWVDPTYEFALFEEALERHLNTENAYDDVDYTKITSSSEILELLHKIVHKTYVHSHRSLVESVDSEIKNNEKIIAEHKENVPEAAPDTEYSVKIHVIQQLDVMANSMEDATEKAKMFTSGMKPGQHVEGVHWMDSYFSREEVSRELVVEHFKE